MLCIIIGIFVHVLKTYSYVHTYTHTSHIRTYITHTYITPTLTTSNFNVVICLYVWFLQYLILVYIKMCVFNT